MSMENGFELDFPGDDDNAERYGSRAEIPGTAGDIPEPDAASIDELPHVITEVENMELVLDGSADCGFGCMPMDHHDTVTTPVVRASVGGLHSLSFTTLTDDGSHTDTVRLTAAELAQTAIVIEEYINETD